MFLVNIKSGKSRKELEYIKLSYDNATAQGSRPTKQSVILLQMELRDALVSVCWKRNGS